MLGAVMFGHRHMQPVIRPFIQLAEKAAKEPRDFAQPDTKAVEKEMLGIVEADLPQGLRDPAKLSARTRLPRSRRRR
jgi:polyribonucleotide nucleotidyltransferase